MSIERSSGSTGSNPVIEEIKCRPERINIAPSIERLFQYPLGPVVVAVRDNLLRSRIETRPDLFHRRVAKVGIIALSAMQTSPSAPLARPTPRSFILPDGSQSKVLRLNISMDRSGVFSSGDKQEHRESDRPTAVPAPTGKGRLLRSISTLRSSPSTDSITRNCRSISEK